MAFSSEFLNLVTMVPVFVKTVYAEIFECMPVVVEAAVPGPPN